MAVSEDTRYQIEGELSYLLETENSSIWHGAEEETCLSDSEDLEITTKVDYETFTDEVINVRDQVIEKIGSDQTPISNGSVLNVLKIAEKLYERVTSDTPNQAKDRTNQRRWIFEESTGIDCRSFFDKQNTLQPLSAAAILEDFFERGHASDYKPGQRYFFGHPITE